MIFLLSGEGKTDLGYCKVGGKPYDSGIYRYGPMAVLVDKLVYKKTEISILENSIISFISETALKDISNNSSKKRSMRLAGKKQKKETTFFANNAHALATKAKEIERKENETVIAILFRDSDGTRSSPRSLWQDKWDSMIQGFERAGYSTGVPMIPCPKSEVWLLCAVKENPYNHCDKLEKISSGNDKSPKPLKDQLDNACQKFFSKNKEYRHKKSYSAEDWNNILKDDEIDIHRIDMPSFNTFKEHLYTILQDCSPD
ncbi:hypothetical protein QUF61_15005 [Candidatus Venteria ishoeyi]|uniref:hypothetical protein n=1 Tax=Candidatus Venteria ishoeyi TaxID=1899563 RepID=UPI0025A65011|nr:hypothetical protein [Candidatus Venteria ishoeyi]MDM8547798.1 hypothetical protein [Candidatus Venteria ishoeyi]